MRKKILCGISRCLLLALLLSQAAACSESAADSTDESTSPGIAQTAVSDPSSGTEEAEEDGNGKEQYAPVLPAVSFDGYHFRIISRDDSMHSYPVHTRDLYADEIRGDAINDAVFQRNAKVEDTYDLKITLDTHNETVSETTPNTLAENSVLADSDDFDLLATHMIYGANSALKHVFLNYGELDYVDFSKPYWNQSAHNAFSVGDKTYLALSDMCFSSNDNTHCMLFNKKLAVDYNVGDLYELIRSNAWTYDRFSSIAEQIAADVNGDGSMTEDDIYGYFIGGGSGLVNWMFAAGLHVMAKDADNIPYLDFYSEKTVTAYEWAYRLAKNDCTYYLESWVSEDVPKFFSEDHALFMTTQIGVIEDLRDMESDFGVLPYPKYDEEQADYAHYVDGHATIMAVPKTVRDLDREGIILEALSYESYLSCLPLYYDVLMTKKNVRDELSGEMLELIYNTRVFDFAYVYDNFGLSFTFQYQIENNTSDIASYYKKNEKLAQKVLERNIKAYQNDD